jgi:hypothetical protein
MGDAMRASEETTAYWKRQVEEFQKSGLRRSVYCEQNQIKVFQFDYWRHKFMKPANAPSKPGWVRLRIKESTADQSGGIRLRMGRLEIEVRSGFDRDLLAEVLRVVSPEC